MISLVDIDTVLLDLDGTLIDLRFDTYLWNELLVARFARLSGVSDEQARDELYGDCEPPLSLEYYSVDHWTNKTRVDVGALHEECRHLLRFRPGVEAFLQRLANDPRRAIIATNAHPRSLFVKDETLSLFERVDACYSAHDFGAPKEERAFWTSLQHREEFDPARTLLIDDNEWALHGARDAGVAHLYTIAQPNLEVPRRIDLSYPCIDNFDDIKVDV